MLRSHQIGSAKTRQARLARFAAASLGLATSALALLGSPAPAAAADFGPPVVVAPRAPGPFNWTSVYLGFNGGAGWGPSEYNPIDPAGSTTSFFVTGGMVGVTAGADIQFMQNVFGVMADADWSFIEGSATCVGTNFTCAARNDWLGTVRARAGYAFDNLLLYVSGGGAWGDVAADRPTLGGERMERIGWSAGAGFEVSLIQNVSFKLEYIHIDLGTGLCGAPNCAQKSDVEVPFRVETIRAGVNWRFRDWPHL